MACIAISPYSCKKEGVAFTAVSPYIEKKGGVASIVVSPKKGGVASTAVSRGGGSHLWSLSKPTPVPDTQWSSASSPNQHHTQEQNHHHDDLHNNGFYITFYSQISHLNLICLRVRACVRERDQKQEVMRVLPFFAFFCSFRVSEDFFLISCRAFLYSVWMKR